MLAKANRKKCALFAFTFISCSVHWNCPKTIIPALYLHQLQLLQLNPSPLASTITSASDSASNPRAATLKLYGDKRLPYQFSSELFALINRRDAQTFLNDGSDEGWPLSFEVKSAACEVCGQPLGPSKLNPGSRGGSILYTKLNPFKEISIKIKECTSNSCKTMHRIFTTEDGKI